MINKVDKRMDLVLADDKGKEEVNFTTSSLELRKLFVNIEGMVGAYIWANDEGEIYKITIPSQGIEVYKDGYKPGPVFKKIFESLSRKRFTSRRKAEKFVFDNFPQKI